jgi:hypothetical protein
VHATEILLSDLFDRERQYDDAKNRKCVICRKVQGGYVNHGYVVNFATTQAKPEFCQSPY